MPPQKMGSSGIKPALKLFEIGGSYENNVVLANQAPGSP